MNRFFRFIIAAWGAKKLGGGCLSTIVIFIIIYMLLGQCNQQSKAANTYTPAKTHTTVPVCVTYYK